jgi:hypothetical protein
MTFSGITLAEMIFGLEDGRKLYRIKNIIRRIRKKTDRVMQFGDFPLPLPLFSLPAMFL